ncbi:unnamed protein product, partial [Mesorhabditis belari]|uniref:Uncharacterized protein n=1 Tax=Mesorhabditis belari TaxID=2138241 RepID=A0AAF3EXH6_9BILA
MIERMRELGPTLVLFLEMTADNDSLLDAVFSAVTLPPVTTAKPSNDHTEYHSSTQKHIDSHQVHSITTHHETSNETHFHSSSISSHDVKSVNEKLAQLATHDDQHSLKRDSLVSTQSSLAPRSARVHSTASSNATSNTSEDTLHKIDSALAERHSLTMGGNESKPASSFHSKDHSRTASIVSNQSQKSQHSINSQKSTQSYHTVASDESDSTITGGNDGEYQNVPHVRAFAPQAPHHDELPILQYAEENHYDLVPEITPQAPHHDELPILQHEEENHYDLVPEITEEIVLEDSHGRILAREEEFPDYAPPPPPIQQQQPLRSPIPTDLLSDLRNSRLYQQNMPDDETNTTISDVRVESILGGHTNGHKAEESDDEESTIVVLRSIVKRDFDSTDVIAVENSAIKRTASQVKPLDPHLKTELQQAMQTRAIEDDSSSSTLSNEEVTTHKDSAPTGAFLHRNSDHSTEVQEHGHKESLVRHSDHEAELHATVEPSHLLHLEKSDPVTEFHATTEPDHWEPHRFSQSTQESHGFEHAVYHGHSAEHSDDEATLTSQDAIPAVKSSEYHLHQEPPLVTSLRNDHPDDYPTYLHGSSISSKASSKASSMSSHDGYRPTGAYLHRGSDGSAQIGIGQAALPRNAPHLDSIPAGGYAYRRDTLTSHASNGDSEHSTATYASVPVNSAQPVSAPPPPQYQPVPQMTGIPRPRAISKDNYSTVSSIKLIPNLYDQPKVTEKLRPVRAQDVLKTLEKEKPSELHYEEPVYDEVYDDHRSHHDSIHSHHAHHNVPSQQHYNAYEQQPIVAGGNVTVEKQIHGSHHSINSDGFVHVKKPIRQSRHEHYLPMGDHFVLQEGVNTLRGRWERGTFRNHEETDSERNYAFHGLAQAIGSSATSTVSSQSKSRSATAVSAVSASTVTSKRSQPKSEITSTTVTESVASKRSKQSGPAQLPRTGLPKSRTSTLQQIHEHEELHVPRSPDELRVDVGPPSGPILAQAPVTSPAYNEKFQSLRVVKSVRQFVQHQNQQTNHLTSTAPPVFYSPHVHAVQAPPQPPPHANDPVPAPRHTAAPPALPQNDTSRRGSVQSQISHVTSISANSSVSQQSARRAHHESVSQHSAIRSITSSHKAAQDHSHHHSNASLQKVPALSHSNSYHSVASQKTGSKQPSLVGSVPRSHKSNGSIPRSHHDQASSKRTSITSQATLTDERVNHQQVNHQVNGHHHEQYDEPHYDEVENHHHETQINPAFEEFHPTEVKIRAETHLLTELVPVAERRALFESTEAHHARNFSINRKNVQHDHLPPMVNLLG